MDDQQRVSRDRGKAEKAGGYSVAFGIISFLFIAVPVLALTSLAFAVLSVRASRKNGLPSPWTSLVGFVLGAMQLGISIWIWTAFLAGQVGFH